LDVGLWQFMLVLAFLIPAIIVAWHSYVNFVENRWIWILVALGSSFLGLAIYMVVYALSRPSERVDSPIVCPSCGNSLTADSKFCNKCGFAFSEEICSKCEASNPTGSIYCRSCGTELRPKCRYCEARMDAGDLFCPACNKAQE